jgi:transposase
MDIHVRTAQRWVKRYEEDPDDIFDKNKKMVRKRIFKEEHKQFLLEYIYENPFLLFWCKW